MRLELKRPWSGATSSIELAPLALIARLAAIIPPPKSSPSPPWRHPRKRTSLHCHFRTTFLGASFSENPVCHEATHRRPKTLARTTTSLAIWWRGRRLAELTARRQGRDAVDCPACLRKLPSGPRNPVKRTTQKCSWQRRCGPAGFSDAQKGPLRIAYGLGEVASITSCRPDRSRRRPVPLATSISVLPRTSAGAFHATSSKLSHPRARGLV